MPNDKIFYNTDLYPNAEDYIIGGFHVNARSETLTYSDIYFKVEERVKRLIEEYFEENVSARLKNNNSEISKNKVYKDACYYILDFLGIQTHSCSINELVADVMNSIQMKGWLSTIKYRYDGMSRQLNFMGVPAHQIYDGNTDHINAIEYTNNTPMAEFFEALSSSED